MSLRSVIGGLVEVSSTGGGNDAVSSSFDNSAVAGQYVGLQINAGASSAWTTTMVDAELVG